MQKTISLIVFTSIVSRMWLNIIAQERAEDSNYDQDWYQHKHDWQYAIEL